MYPTEKHPVYGVFVKNTELLLSNYGFKTSHKALIKGRKKGLEKLFFYLKLHIKTFLLFFSKNFDLVLVHYPLQISPLLLFVSFFQKKKLVLNIHGSELNNSPFFHRFFHRLLFKSNLIIVPSSFYKSKLIDEYQQEASKIYIYPSGGINLNIFQAFDKSKMRKKNGIKNDSFVCSYISTIIDAKGWRSFFESSEKLIELINDIKFLVVGNGPQENEFKELVKSKKLDSYYYFFDRQEQSKLVEFYNCSDLFIFPSHKESLGLVALESLACGTPVVAPSKPPFTDYIKNGENGFLFKLKNVINLTSQIYNFYKLSNKEAMVENAIKSSKKYEDKRVSLKLAKTLKELLKTKN